MGGRGAPKVRGKLSLRHPGKGWQQSCLPQRWKVCQVSVRQPNFFAITFEENAENQHSLSNQCTESPDQLDY